MAYQRGEYADKTLSRNSFADRKLKIQLDSINCHKGSTEKEIDREKKKIQKELAEAEEYMKKRLSVNDIAACSEKRTSPRFPRRYSTPPVTLARTLSDRNLPEVGKRAHNSNRTQTGSDMLMKVPCGAQALPDGFLSPGSLTPTLLKPPFNQPRRQSLPPLNPGGIINQDFKVQLVNKESSHSLSMTSRSQPITPPRSLSPRESAIIFHAESDQVEDVMSKVNKFLKSFDDIKTEQNCDANTGQKLLLDEDNNRLDAYEGSSDVLSTSGTLKRCSSVGLFQPANFE